LTKSATAGPHLPSDRQQALLAAWRSTCLVKVSVDQRQVVDAAASILVGLLAAPQVAVVPASGTEQQQQQQEGVVSGGAPGSQAAGAQQQGQHSMQGADTSASSSPSPQEALFWEADPEQAAGLLQLLPLPEWSIAFAVFVDPVKGSFCWDQHQVAAAIAAAARMQPPDGRYGRQQYILAAWQVVAAQSNMAVVLDELQEVMGAASGGSGGPSGVKSTAGRYSLQDIVPLVLQGSSDQEAAQHLAALVRVVNPMTFIDLAQVVVNVPRCVLTMDGTGGVVKRVAQAATAVPPSPLNSLLLVLSFVGQQLMVDQCAAFLPDVWNVLSCYWQREYGNADGSNKAAVRIRTQGVEAWLVSRVQQVLQAVAAARDTASIDHLAVNLVKQGLSREQASAVLFAWDRRISAGVRQQLQAAARGRLVEEVDSQVLTADLELEEFEWEQAAVWQLGQSSTGQVAPAVPSTSTSSSRGGASTPAAGAGGGSKRPAAAGSSAVPGVVEALVGSIPPAPPAGGSDDVLQVRLRKREARGKGDACRPTGRVRSAVLPCTSTTQGTGWWATHICPYHAIHHKGISEKHSVAVL
jgi:hypothetical protein